jgi:carbon storage regulator
MLVLTRRNDEEIVIGGTICIRVLDLHGHRVRIGISAPTGITVDRGEVHRRRSEFAEAPAASDSVALNI